MVVFRTDANTDIGEGHVMRCIAVAKELLRLGKGAVFITADECPCELLNREGLAHIVLNTDWTRMDEETEKLLSLFREIKVDCMLVDSYSASPEYLKSFKGEVKTAYMDDFGLRVYPADIVINYNAYCGSIPYERMYQNSSSKLLLGARYAPLREEFRSPKPKIVSDQINSMMITTGSTDPYHVTGKLIEQISADRLFDGINVHLVAGRYYTNTTELRNFSRLYPHIIIHENVASMAELMHSCDIAVSASGSTVYELCACGIPSVIFSFADNQAQIREYFGSRGAMIDCGDIRYLGESCVDKIICGIKKLGSKDERDRRCMDMTNIIDGRGAERLAACLADLS